MSNLEPPYNLYLVHSETGEKSVLNGGKSYPKETAEHLAEGLNIGLGESKMKASAIQHDCSLN